MTEDIKERLQVLIAWLTPGGPKPDHPMPSKFKTTSEALARIEALEAELATVSDVAERHVVALANTEAELDAAEAQLAAAREALEVISQETFTDGTPTKAARIALAALVALSPAQPEPAPTLTGLQEEQILIGFHKGKPEPAPFQRRGYGALPPPGMEWQEGLTSAEILAGKPAEPAPTRAGRHPVERLWRECGLPEYFLGNDGSNTKLYALYDAILALRDQPTTPTREEMKTVLVEVDGCFQAAYAEGLSERLAEADQSPGTLADLIFRRLVPAHQAACVVLADDAILALRQEPAIPTEPDANWQAQTGLPMEPGK